jgi:dihydroorotase
MSTKPAQIIRSDRGTLKEGAVADITVIDPNARWTIDKEQFASKSRNCPFHGWQVTGRPTYTIVGGEVKWRLG